MRSTAIAGTNKRCFGDASGGAGVSGAARAGDWGVGARGCGADMSGGGAEAGGRGGETGGSASETGGLGAETGG